MATFNIELWQKLKTEFLDGNVYFGQAPENTPAPYCTLWVLDSGRDEQTKTLCGADGISSIQFNIYGFNDMQLDELLDELNNILEDYKLLTSYRIKMAIRGTCKPASSFSSEVGQGFTSFDFSYEKL